MSELSFKKTALAALKAFRKAFPDKILISTHEVKGAFLSSQVDHNPSTHWTAGELVETNHLKRILLIKERCRATMGESIEKVKECIEFRENNEREMLKAENKALRGLEVESEGLKAEIEALRAKLNTLEGGKSPPTT